MAKIIGRLVVIDADVARSAGETEHPISSSCRNFLKIIRDNGHVLVITKELKREWDKHQSGYFRRWKISMISKKRFKSVNIEESEKIENEIIKISLSKNQEKIALKDSHLIDAARKTDQFIASRDDTARAFYCKLADIIMTLLNIIWINPTNLDDQQIIWINSRKTRWPKKEWTLEGE